MMVHPVAPAITCNETFPHNLEAIDYNISFANFDVHSFSRIGSYLT
jgi:hypothetical protein